jgi:hypothetical protein
MLPHSLLWSAVLAAGGYLLVVSLILELVGRTLRIRDSIASGILEPYGLSWWLMTFVMELLFYVVIPTVAFAFFYFSLPLSGVRAGLAAALYAFTLGAAPVLMSLSVRVKLPMSFMLFLLLSYLIKVGGCMTIVAWLYSL